MSENEKGGGGEEIKRERERELSELELSWGEGNPLGLPHSMGCGCENPECLKYGGLASWHVEGIGVKKAPVVGSDGRRMALVCECDKCFSRFWFHISDDDAKILKNDNESGLTQRIRDNKKLK